MAAVEEAGRYRYPGLFTGTRRGGVGEASREFWSSGGKLGGGRFGGRFRYLQQEVGVGWS